MAHLLWPPKDQCWGGLEDWPRTGCSSPTVGELS